MLVKLLVLLVMLLLPLTTAYAIYDPFSVPNNKFGIHIADTNNIPEVAPLVNSSGGDWGYVTLVIHEDDRDIGKWQGVFNQMRRLHLIPLLRLATRVDGDRWIKPEEKTVADWVAFLDKLNWPIKNRYVILFNEPNHANEWGGSVSPEDYAQIALLFTQKLKQASDDFFVLPAGLDVSAVSDKNSLDAAVFLRRMIKAAPDFLNLIDGWTSHSYPNPDFSGTPYEIGRGTLRSYEWELTSLRQLGLTRNLPVFITETGWLHSEGKLPNPGLLSPTLVGQNLQLAATLVWQDNRIVAVTPFVFSYQDLPFDHFSWKKIGVNDYYPQFASYQTIGKIRGLPLQIQKFSFTSPLVPGTLVADSAYSLATGIINDGQSILSAKDQYELNFKSSSESFTALFDAVSAIEPGETGNVSLHLKIPRQPGNYHISVALRYPHGGITLEEKDIMVVPPPALAVQVRLGWRISGSAADTTILVYEGDKLLHKFTALTVTEGMVNVPGLTNIVPGRVYRIVALVPNYLPRQSLVVINQKETTVTFKRFWPLDFNRDGAFSLADLKAIFAYTPHDIVGLFIGQ